MAKRGGNERNMKSDSDNGKSSRGEHNYSGHDSMKPYGSPMGKAMRGPGPVEGAGEVVSGNPGRAAGRVNQGSDSVKALGSQDMYKGSKEKPPKGMKTQYGGEEA